MALKFLQTLAGLPLPYTTSHRVEILHIEVLQTADLILAEVPGTIAGEFVGPAVVHAITSTGSSIVASLGRTETVSK